MSTLRAPPGPSRGRSDGSGRSSSRSTRSRSAGTAQISVCRPALTSAHHAPRPRSPRPGRRTAPAARPGRAWRSRPGSPRPPSTPGRPPRRSRAGTRSGWRSARSPGSAPPRWRPPRPSGSPSGRRAPPPAPRRAPRSTRPAAAAWSPAFSSGAKRTNRHRDQASTAQNTCSPSSTAPVDHQVLARRPHPRPDDRGAAAAPASLRLGHQPAEVARRPGIAGRPRRRQQPLRRDPTPGRLHPLGDQPATAS